MLSHGKAVDVIRRNAPGAAAGITLNLGAVYPATESEADTEAARLMDLHHNRWFLDPIFCGSYPADGAYLDQVQSYVRPGDLEQISVPLDFLGINNYTRSVVVLDTSSGQPRGVHQDGSEYTEMDWEVAPEGIHDLLVRVHEDYGPPMIYVTENGAAFPDVRVHDGSVRDPERIAYLEAYIAACSRAIEEGVPLAGYFVWSFLDNFEWGYGYSRRFGIVYVDYPTLERIPKSSYHWYRRLIENQVGAVAAAV
jgi:beta-glucosidase